MSSRRADTVLYWLIDTFHCFPRSPNSVDESIVRNSFLVISSFSSSITRLTAASPFREDRAIISKASSINLYKLFSSSERPCPSFSPPHSKAPRKRRHVITINKENNSFLSQTNTPIVTRGQIKLWSNGIQLSISTSRLSCMERDGPRTIQKTTNRLPPHARCLPPPTPRRPCRCGGRGGGRRRRGG